MNDTVDGGDDHPIAAFLLNLRDVARELVDRTIGASRTQEGLNALCEGLNNISDLSIDRVARLMPSDRSIACRAKCSGCCRFGLVVTDQATAIYVARYAAETLPPQAVMSWAQRLSEGRRAPCSFLVDDNCAIYAARPVVCRAFNAYDASACNARELPEIGSRLIERAYAVPFGIAAAVANGLDEGLRAANLASGQVELNAAVRMVLSEPETVDQWLAGEDVFAPMRRDAVPAGA